MSVSDRIQKAKETLSPKEYYEYLKATELADLTLESVSASLNRDALIGPDDLKVKVSRNVELGAVKKSTPPVMIEFGLRAGTGRKPPISIKATYRLELEVKGHSPPEEFFLIYAMHSGQAQVWPFARELVHSITTRMGLTPLVLPLLLEGEE